MSSDLRRVEPMKFVASDEPIVSARGASKAYHIYARPIDRLKQTLFRGRRAFYTEFWALRDVSFELGRGCAMGIVGRNGSGKSTLLQIIAGTLTPTSGEVAVRGRVSALLELGAGFNVEFTGRENALLNGSIYGISREEMRERLDQILAFAEIEEFIDRPIKTYSSGMVVRLAFSIAISVEPDLLIVDEALSVGDVGFQHKCMSRIKQMRERGVSLLFVSHSTSAINSLCETAILLDHGRCVASGDAADVSDRYLKLIREDLNRRNIASRQAAPSVGDGSHAVNSHTPLGVTLEFRVDPDLDVPGKYVRYGTHDVLIRAVELLDADGRRVLESTHGDLLTLRVHAEAQRPASNLSFSFLVRDSSGVDVFGTTTFDEKIQIPAVDGGDRLICDFRFRNILRPNSFSFCVSIGTLSTSSDIVELDHLDGVSVFVTTPAAERSVHYQVWNPIEVSVREVVSGT